MNEIKKIGMYSTDEILEFMTEGEGRGFLGRSMFDAMYFKIKNLQSKIDKVNQYFEEYFIFDDKNGEYYQTHTFDKDNAKELHDILKEDK